MTTQWKTKNESFLNMYQKLSKIEILGMIKYTSLEIISKKKVHAIT